MRASIVRAARVERQSTADDEAASIDALVDAVADLHVTDLRITTAHGKTVISGIARYQVDRDQLFEAIKRLDGWDHNVVVDVTVERHDIRGYHTVRPGETLASIARRYFGDPSKDLKIFDANRDRMNDPDQILPGQQLLIP